MKARGRGEVDDRAPAEDGRKSRRNTQRSRRNSQSGPPPPPPVHANSSFDDREEARFWRRRALEMITLVWYSVFTIPVLVVGIFSVGKACQETVEIIVVILGAIFGLQALFRFLALYPHYACEAEEFPDTQIMMVVWMASRALEAGLWCCVALMPYLEEFEVCDELLDKMMLTISIAWPIFYVILNLAYFYVQSDGGGSF